MHLPRISGTIDSYNARYSVEKKTTMAFDGANFEENPMKWDRERKSQRGRLRKEGIFWLVLVCGRQQLFVAGAGGRNTVCFDCLYCCVVCVSTFLTIK